MEEQHEAEWKSQQPPPQGVERATVSAERLHRRRMDEGKLTRHEGSRAEGGVFCC